MKSPVLFSFVSLIFFNITSSGNHPGPVITTLQGDIEGTWKQTINGRMIQAFRSIPYAVPPVGPRRFKYPEPFTAWPAVLDGTNDPPPCPQLGVYVGKPSSIIGNEDCLYLNVYTPDAAEKGKYPVMVFIHGGGFHSGACLSNLYGPDILLDRDIVLVVPNYRLGILGFGSTEDELIPGNLGLKDQLLALAWVQENIAAYGGNPDSVTIFGHGAGGASVHYHMLSSKSAGLFHRAIPMSGTAYMPWAVSAPRKITYFIKKLGHKLQCPISSTEEVINCLSNIPAGQLVHATSSFMAWEGLDPLIIFTPVLEQESTTSFITLNSYYSHTSVPMIIGATTEEGAFKVAVYLTSTVKLEHILTKLDRRFDRIAPASLSIEDKFDNPGEVADQIKEFFFEDKAISINTLPELVNMFSDVIIYEGVKMAVRRHKGTAFMYLFGYDGGSYSFCHTLSDGKFKYGGVCHSDELQYLFPLGLLKKTSEFSEEEKRVSRRFVDYFVNFATFGNPTPYRTSVQWTPSENVFNYLFISDGKTKMKGNFQSDSEDFWNYIKKFRKIIPRD